MKEKTARTWTPRLGLELPDVLLPDIRDLPIISTVGKIFPTIYWIITVKGFIFGGFIIFIVTGFPVLDNFFLQLQGCVSVLRRFSGHSIFSQIQPFSGTLTENGWMLAENGSAICGHFQPFSAKMRPFSAKFGHFQPWKWLNLAEFWLNLAEIGWNSRERGKERPWSLYRIDCQSFWELQCQKNQDEIIKITVTYFGKNGNS